MSPSAETAGVDEVSIELRRTVAEIMASEELRGLQHRLVLGEVHGDPVAEVTARRRPDSGVVSGLIVVSVSVIVAFAVGFASVAITDARETQGTSSTSGTP